MNRFKAALVTLIKGSQPLSIRDPEHWSHHGESAPTGESVNAKSVLGLSSAWACVNLLAGTQASLPLMPYQTAADGSRSVAREHPLYRLLHDSPNSLQTSVDFWEFMCASIELWGNAYARAPRMSGRVVSLVPVMPELPVVTDLGNGRLRYRWSENGRSYDETSDTMLHIRGFGGNPLGGMSTLTFGARAFGLAIATDKAAGATFKNGLRPSVAVVFKEVIGPDRRDQVEAGLTKKFAGAMNAGRPFILEGDSDIKTLSINPEEAQMLESRSFSVEEVCRFYGVPPHMVGHTTKTTSWGTGLEQQTLGFLQFTLRRRLKRVEQALEKQLLTAEDRAAGIAIEFNVEGLLRGDSAGRSEFYQRALGDTQKPGWMVRNEVRRLENLPPIDGWDEPIDLITSAPVTEPPPAKKPPLALPPPDDEDEED